MTNNSQPLGSTNWFQGNATVFVAQNGAPDSYIAANFNNSTYALSSVISNWLILPALTLNNGDTVSFYTRTADNSEWPDRLEVRLNPSNTTDVGSTALSVGDFALILLSINENLVVGGYPSTWTQYTATVSGLTGPTSSRLAIRYFVSDTINNSNYIGIDTLSVDSSAVPEPSTLLLMGAGLASLVLLRRR